MGLPYEADLAELDAWFNDPDGLDDTVTEAAHVLQDAGAPDDSVGWLVTLGAELADKQIVRARPAHLVWGAAVDAIILSQPDLLDEVLPQVETELLDSDSPAIIRSLGPVDAEPGVLARVLGSATTVGSTLEGWTVRQLARLLAVMWLTDESPDADVPFLDRVPPAVRLIQYARRVDPQADVDDQDALRDVLGRAIIEAEHSPAVATGQFAQSVLHVLNAGDPLATVTLAKRIPTQLASDIRDAAVSTAKAAAQGAQQIKSLGDTLLGNPIPVLALAGVAAWALLGSAKGK